MSNTGAMLTQLVRTVFGGAPHLAQRATQPEFTEIDLKALDALIQRVAEAREYNLALSSEDMRLLLNALMTLAYLQGRLNDKDITLNTLRKLLGMVQSSEKLKDILPDLDAANEPNDEEKPDEKPDSENPKKPTQKRRPPKPRNNQPVKPAVEHHTLQTLSKGDRCPDCEQGTLYKYEPAQLLRITGNSPYTPVMHVMERLRCNTCGEYFTAELPDDVKKEGSENQKYGYSARSLMGINKCFAGTPFYRQESLQALLGVSITASTVFDQCEHLANALQPVHNVMVRLAADAVHYHLDDTTHRIVDLQPITKKPRNGNKERRRSGVYSSGLIATLEDGPDIVLFKTNIGHAGEFIDEILDKRSTDKSPPILMSDALSHNQPTKPHIWSRCNAHGRRKFVDVIGHFPDEVKWVLECYGKIWVNEEITRNEKLSPAERLEYHKKHSLPIMEKIRRWCNEQLQQEVVEENSGLGKAIRYFDKHFEGLTCFCRVEGARLDNNLMEQQLKLIVRGRKNSGFYKTQAGADVSDVITSMIASAIRAGINAFNYFNEIQRRQADVKAHPEKWLPWNFQG